MGQSRDDDLRKGVLVVKFTLQTLTPLHTGGVNAGQMDRIHETFRLIWLKRRLSNIFLLLALLSFELGSFRNSLEYS